VLSERSRPRVTVRPPGAPREYREPWLRRGWAGFRAWRRSRPFWGGLWTILGGLLMAAGPLTAIKVILVAGTTVLFGVLVGVIVVAMGVFLWFTPHLRQVVGVLAVLFSLVSLITSDYGGFVLGLLLGTIGGAMGFAWAPVQPPATKDAG
jgi:hypothetical protein